MNGPAPTAAPVLVVGAGPVGLTAANLLAARGVPVLVIERNATTSDEAKAISLDDESLRALQAAGCADAVLDIVVPGTGTRYYDRHARSLFHARGPRPALQRGFAFKNQFAQPELETALLRALKTRTDVEVRFSTELVALTEHEDGTVTARLRESGTADVRTRTVSWVLGCDGGRSTTRQLKGIDMSGASYDEVWLVVDTVEDPHRERYGMHHGDPRRPTVIVPGRDGRCRYEFRQHPGEAARGARPDFALIERLISPYRPIRPEHVERCTAYTFNAVVADRWRDGRCFLLGDAAHMMPPFAGQGLNSGIRDAANLAWKIAGVWHGQLGEAVLDSYEPERRPHAAATVRFSERLGRIVMTTSRPRALVRDLVLRAMLRTGRGRRYLADMRFRPRAVHHAGLVVRDRRRDHVLTGTQLPQPFVLVPPGLRPRRLDEVLGGDFALLGVDVPDAAWASVAGWDALGLPVRKVAAVLGDRLPESNPARLAVADADGALDAALASARGRFLLVKPDRYIAAVFTADQAARAHTELTTLLGLNRKS